MRARERMNNTSRKKCWNFFLRCVCVTESMEVVRSVLVMAIDNKSTSKSSSRVQSGSFVNILAKAWRSKATIVRMKRITPPNVAKKKRASTLSADAKKYHRLARGGSSLKSRQFFRLVDTAFPIGKLHGMGKTKPFSSIFLVAVWSLDTSRLQNKRLSSDK